MKTFKQVDLYINIILLASLCGWVLADASRLFIAYFIIGGWQVFSMLVHFINRWFMRKSNSRSLYHWISLCSVSFMLLSIVIKPFLFIFFIMLFIAPVMATVYTLMCSSELKELKQNEHLSLK